MLVQAKDRRGLWYQKNKKKTMTTTTITTFFVYSKRSSSTKQLAHRTNMAEYEHTAWYSNVTQLSKNIFLYIYIILTFFTHARAVHILTLSSCLSLKHCPRSSLFSHSLSYRCHLSMASSSSYVQSRSTCFYPYYWVIFSFHLCLLAPLTYHNMLLFTTTK